MDYFDRKIISIHETEDLTEPERILEQTIRTPVRKLPLTVFQEHEKQSSSDDSEDTTDQLTNQSIGGVQRARELAAANSDDSLPAVYGGLFTVAEYFTRSFDAIKGKFFEKVIAAEEDSHRLDVDRNLGSLIQYVLEPNLCWKNLDYTREELTDEETARMDELASITLDLAENNRQANADATIFFEEEGTLVFGEHRTSVVTGGTTARRSLLRKPRALVRELSKSNKVLTIPTEIATRYDIEAKSYAMAELLNEAGVDEIHFHIGILFNEKRTPARWEEDPQQGTSRRLIEEFEEDLPTDLKKNLRNIDLNSENLRLAFEIPITPDSDETVSFHLSYLYGDVYLNTLYTGSLAAVGKAGSMDAFEDRRSLRGIISDNDADDLWLGFSIAERESKVFEISSENRNNAMEIADLILDESSLTTRLAAFRQLCRTGGREEIDRELLSFAQNLAERYDDERTNSYVEWVYGGNPLDYLQDVAIETLVYDAISRPIFLREFPTYENESKANRHTLAEARRTFEKYLFETGADTEKKERIFRCVREHTEYTKSGTTIPADENDEVEWTSALTTTEIGDSLDIRAPTRILKSMVEGTNNTEGRILTKCEKRYAVPAPVAARMGPFMLDNGTQR